MKTMQLNVVTPDGTVFEGQVELVSVKTTDGEIGIMPMHIPLVSPLEIGPVRVTKENKKELIAVSGGFVEVRPDEVNILAESAELASQIDVARARAAKERAERRLQQAKQENIDYHRAELALKRALNRLKVSEAAQSVR